MDVLAEGSAVTRRFGAFTAVSGADLTIAGGEVVGLIGGNGAGKTTLIRLLLGLLAPTGGSVRLFGSAPSLETRRRVGYVPQTLGLYAGLTVAENWSFTATAFRTTGIPMPERISAWRNELVAGLPLGAQRQVAFAIALSHGPELLVLDEPTSGVGPLGSARLWEQIRHSAEQGAGVLVSTHSMEEAGQCDRLVVMAAGKVVATGTVTDVIGGRQATQIHCDDVRRAFAVLDSAGLPVQLQGGALRLARTNTAAASLLSQAGIAATVEMVPANLEEAFVAISATA
ncbi:MAG TPA: ABC transporter ATP-binding protein [Trebonia sp.]|nr:ABC transporter ATP-binding protein [Trebonia sp.]